MFNKRKNVISWTSKPNEIFNIQPINETSSKTLWVEEKQMAILIQSTEIKQWFDGGKYDIRSQISNDALIIFVNLNSFQYDFAMSSPVMNTQLNIPISAMGYSQLTIKNPMVLLMHLLSHAFEIDNKALFEYLDQVMQKKMSDFFQAFMQVEDLFFDIKKISVLFRNFVKDDLEELGLLSEGLKLTYISLPSEIVETYTNYLSCLECNKMIPKHSKFCPHCGTSQLKTCESCGDIIEHQYCPHCGYGSDNTTLE